VSISVQAFDEVSSATISDLNHRLREYYRNPPKSYYEIADQAAAQYTTSDQPFHCDLVGRVRRGTCVLELGCGSAHLCRFVQKEGGHYTGMDHSDELLQKNRLRFPEAEFFSIGSEVKKQFDIVASLYTIEHVVDPPNYLERMWKFCRAGGLIAVICPDFVASRDFPPSFYYGRTARRFRKKLSTLSLIDAVGHLADLFLFAPHWKRKALTAPPGKFWINLNPRIFAGAPYSVDADALHLPNLNDLVFWMERRGANIIATSRTLPGIDPNILRFNCYVIARKPA